MRWCVLVLLILSSVPTSATAQSQTSSRFTVQVVDMNGRPVRGVALRAVLVREDLETATVTTGRRGTASFALGDAERIQVAAVAPDGRVGMTDAYNTTPCAHPDCYVPGIDTVLALPIEPPGQIHGRVLGPGGQPAAGARVRIAWVGGGQGTSLRRLFPTYLAGGAQPLRRPRLVFEGGPIAWGGLFEEARTAADGTYVINVPRSGMYSVLIDHTGAADYASDPVQVVPTAVTRVHHQLLQGFRLTVRIANVAGRPASGGVASIGAGCDRTWLPIENGSVDFGSLPRGTYRVWATLPGGVHTQLRTARGRRRPIVVSLRADRSSPDAAPAQCEMQISTRDPYAGIPDDEVPCAPAVDLHAVGGETHVVRVRSGPDRHVRVGDVLERADGVDAAHLLVFGVCGTRTVWSIRRPATGRRLDVHLTRSEPIDAE